MAYKRLASIAAVGTGAVLAALTWRSGGGSPAEQVERDAEDCPDKIARTNSILPREFYASSQEPLMRTLPGGSTTYSTNGHLGPKGGVATSSEEKRPLEEAVERCRGLVRRVMVEQGVPGAVVAVARDGKVVWSEGMGLADVENDTPCTRQTG